MLRYTILPTPIKLSCEAASACEASFKCVAFATEEPKALKDVWIIYSLSN